MARQELIAGFLFAFLISGGICNQPKKIIKKAPGEKQPHIDFESFKTDIQSNQETLFHLKGKHAVGLPVEIDLVLIGFDGDGGFAYTMNAAELQSLLSETYSSRTPVARETNQLMAVEYHIRYNVYSASKGDLEAVEQALKAAMTKGSVYTPSNTEKVWGFDDTPTQTYNVEATVVEPVIDRIVAGAFENKYKGDEFTAWQTNMAIVLLNPSKRRMSPIPKEEGSPDGPKVFSTADWDTGEFDVESLTAEDGKYIYQYQYNGAGKSQTWLAGSPYLVIDISAGPCDFGPMMGPQGSVSPSDIPRILPLLYQGASAMSLHHTEADAHDVDDNIMKNTANARDTFFIGEMASTITGAIKHVILPDIWVENVQDSRRLLISLMLLRNHLDSNLLDKSDEHSVNVTRMQMEVYRLMGRRDKSVVSTSAYSLHEHKPLAIALHKAMSWKSSGVVLGSAAGQFQQGYHGRVDSFLDGDLLLEQFEEAGDMLTQGWLGSVKRSGADIWGESGQKASSIGTRVLPVFLLSLKDAPYDLVFDDGGLAVSDDRAVIALQTLSSYGGNLGEIDTKHRAQDARVFMSTVDIERHIMAGIATSLMGIPQPQEVVSHDFFPGKVVVDWRWATGHTPFGPYSNTSTFSALTTMVAHRNMMVAKVDRLVTSMQLTLKKMDAFLKDYLCPPFEELGIKSGGFGASNLTWADQLYKFDASRTASMVPKGTANRVHRVLRNFEQSFHDLTFQFYQGDVNGLDTTIESMQGWGKGLEEYINSEIERSRGQLTCCKVVHTFPKQEAQRWIWVVFVFLGLCALVLFGSCRAQDEGGPLLAVTNRML